MMRESQRKDREEGRVFCLSNNIKKLCHKLYQCKFASAMNYYRASISNSPRYVVLRISLLESEVYSTVCPI